MTPQEFAVKMDYLSTNLDTEASHSRADDLMCEILKELGYEDGIKIFEEMDKWYA